MNQLASFACAAALGVFLLPAAATAQNSRPETAPASRGVSDPVAVALLKKAVADQTGGDSSFELRDLQADIVATLYEKGEDGTPRPHTANVTEFWKARTATATERYRRDLKVEDKETVHGFDGNVFWEKLGVAPPRALTGRDDRDTRRQLQTELSRINDLASALLLSRFDLSESTITMLDAPKKLKTEDGEVEVRVVRRARSGKPVEDLYFGEKTFGKDGAKTILIGLKRQGTERTPTEMLKFARHRLAGEGASRLIVPLVVETYENEVLILVGRVRDVKDLKFNTGIEDVIFAPALR